MKDTTAVPRPFKEYSVTSDELKAALGIDWPGKILLVSRDYSSHDSFEITMATRPDDLAGEQRERYTRDVTVKMPAAEPVPPPAPAPERRKRWLNW